MNETDNDKKTIGEELYLVHLERFTKEERSSDDFDHEVSSSNKKLNKPTPGEELWLVHCKRSEGVELEADQVRDDVPPPKKLKGELKKKASLRSKPRVMHLRNRDVAIHG